MSIFNELPKEFKPLIVLGEINGYLHIFSFLENETLATLLEMGLESIENQDYDEKTTTLQ